MIHLLPPCFCVCMCVYVFMYTCILQKVYVCGSHRSIPHIFFNCFLPYFLHKQQIYWNLIFDNFIHIYVIYCGHIDCLLSYSPPTDILPLLKLSPSYFHVLSVCLHRSCVGNHSCCFYDSISQVISRRLFTGLFLIFSFENFKNTHNVF